MFLIKDTINNGEKFIYNNAGKRLEGFYNKSERVFVGKGDNGITTVINKVSDKYIKNLKFRQ